MSHGSETRRMRGGKIGVGGRRSREGAGLGASLRMTEDEGTLRSLKIKEAYNQIGREIKHDWFGDSKEKKGKKGSPVKNIQEVNEMFVMPKTRSIVKESERAKLIRKAELEGIKLRTDYTSLINRKR